MLNNYLTIFRGDIIKINNIGSTWKISFSELIEPSRESRTYVNPRNKKIVHSILLELQPEFIVINRLISSNSCCLLITIMNEWIVIDGCEYKEKLIKEYINQCEDCFLLWQELNEGKK